MAEDIDRFIQEQKSKLARERNNFQQENTRKVMEQDSMNYATTGSNGFKENIPPAEKGVAMDTRKALPVGNHDSLRDKLARERHGEYQLFLAEKEKRSAPRAQSQVPLDGSSLPIPTRDSAKVHDNSRMARNKEYNDFLKSKGGNTARKPRFGNEELSPSVNQRPGPVNTITGEAMTKTSPTQQNGYPPSTNPRHAVQHEDRMNEPQVRREAASQTPRPILKDYDDRPPPGPRRGWGTPQPDYDELLRRKREEEARYRRYDDDFDYYPGRGGMRPSYSDPHLNRYPPEDERYSRTRYDTYDQEYDRRRVRFNDDRNSNDGGYPPPGNMRNDRPPVDRPPVNRAPVDALNDPVGYDWNLSRGGRSRTLPEMDRQSRSGRPNGSRAPDYVDSNPPRAKSATLRTEEIGMAIGNRDTASATRKKKEQYRKELEQQMKETQEAKKREKQGGLPINASGTHDPAKKQPPTQQAGYQPSFRNQAYPNAQGSSMPPQVPALGLQEAISKSRLGEAPMIEKPFSLNNYQSALTATSTDPYMYYGMRNPMDPDPGKSDRFFSLSLSFFLFVNFPALSCCTTIFPVTPHSGNSSLPVLFGCES